MVAMDREYWNGYVDVLIFVVDMIEGPDDNSVSATTF